MSAQLSLIASAFDVWLGSLGLPGDTVYEGVVYQPQNGRPYFSARMAAYTRQPQGTGPNAAYLESGTYQVNVNRPLGEGLQPARAAADSLAASLARGTMLALGNGGSVTVQNVAAGPAIEAGAWVSVPVSFSWFALS